jgi:hypothetical protein
MSELERPLITPPDANFHKELARCLRHLPFAPFPPPDISFILSLLRKHLPDVAACKVLLGIADNEVGHILVSFRPDYVEHTIVRNALYGEGPTALHALASLFALLGIALLFTSPGPEEREEVYLFGRLSSAAVAAAGPLTTPTVELIEAMYARVQLEFMRQGQLEEPARSTLAIACMMCYNVSDNALRCT